MSHKPGIEGENFREKGLKSLVVLPEKNEKNDNIYEVYLEGYYLI